MKERGRRGRSRREASGDGTSSRLIVRFLSMAYSFGDIDIYVFVLFDHAIVLPAGVCCLRRVYRPGCLAVLGNLICVIYDIERVDITTDHQKLQKEVHPGPELLAGGI